MATTIATARIVMAAARWGASYHKERLRICTVTIMVFVMIKTYKRKQGG